MRMMHVRERIRLILPSGAVESGGFSVEQPFPVGNGWIPRQRTDELDLGV